MFQLDKNSHSINQKKEVEFEYAESFSPVFYFANQQKLYYLSRIVSIILTMLCWL